MPIEEDGSETNDQSGRVDIELRPHYVYGLVDPRDGDVFYVGKGQNGRIKEHERAARSDEAAETAKNKHIRAIHAAGKEVEGRVIARFDTQAEAFAVEAVLIHWMYGRRIEEGGPLTNIQAGHGHRHVRPMGNLQRRPGLDVPDRIAIEPGKYSRDRLGELLSAGIPDIAREVLDRVREGLVRRGIDLEFDDPRVVESGRYIASVAKLCNGVVMRLQFDPRKLITNVRATDETEGGRDSFTQAVTKIGLEPKKHGRYAWLDGWLRNDLDFTDTGAILGRIQSAYDLFGQSPARPPASAVN